MNKTLKIGIVSGLIASFIFIYFLDPFLRWFGSFLVYISSISYSAFADRLFAEAVSGGFIEPTLVIIVFFVVGSSFFLLMAVISSKPIQELCSRNLLFGILIIIIFMIVTSSTNLFKHNLVKTFEQQMKILAPYLSEDQEEILWSKWAQIKTKTEYKMLIEELESYSKQYNIILLKSPLFFSKRIECGGKSRQQVG